MRSGKHAILLLAFLRAGLAQEPAAPPPAPLDLPAIAKLLEGDGKLPDVLATMPAGLREECLEVAAALRGDERDALLDASLANDVATHVAVRLLTAGDGMSGTRLGLAREIRACFAIARAAGELDLTHQLRRGRASGWHDAGPLARRRGAMLTAKFLREYPEAPEVGQLLVLAASAVGDDDRSAVCEAGLRLLGDEATARERLQRVFARFRAGDLPAVEAAIADVERARPARLVDRRAADASELAAVRERLASARAWEAAASAPGLDGRIAKLRLLQRTNTDAAIAEARAMVAEGVEHVQPSIVLVAAAAVAGDFEAAATHLARARNLPGADFRLAAAVAFVDGMPKLRRPAGAPARDFEALFRQCDAIVEHDAAAPAVLWRGLRTLGLLGNYDPAALANTRAIAEVAKTLPRSIPAATLALTAAANADVDDGFAVLDGPPPAELSWSFELVRLRATIATQLTVLADDDRHAAIVERALRDLEQVQNDPRDVQYLRGLLAWSRSMRRDAPAELLAQAFEHFTKARRMAFEHGAWPAALGQFLAGVATDAKFDRQEAARVQDIVVDTTNAGQLTPFAAFYVLRQPEKTRNIEIAEGLLRRLEPSQSACRRTLLAALAAAHAARGDSGDAREVAKQALAVEIPPRTARLLERGVLVDGQFQWGWKVFVHDADFDVTLRLELLPLPQLPSRERLEELARDG